MDIELSAKGERLVCFPSTTLAAVTRAAEKRVDTSQRGKKIVQNTETKKEAKDMSDDRGTVNTVRDEERTFHTEKCIKKEGAEE